MSHCSIVKKTVVEPELKLLSMCRMAQNLVERKLYRVAEIANKEAVLFKSEHFIHVAWEKRSLTYSPIVGDIVNPIFDSISCFPNGVTEIERLVVCKEPPETNLNLFDLVPIDWVEDRSLIKRASTILASLNNDHQKLFNSILWDHYRLKRFCTGPSSLSGHHSESNGNLRHSLEVAEEMQRLCQGRPSVNTSLGVLLALLHDIGKADEYTLTASGGCKMSERGILLGHKATAFEWVVEAINRWNIALPQDHYLAILHVLSATPHAPDWMGLRQPMMLECELLSMADRLSGKDDLMFQTTNHSGGFGRYHKHLACAPFSVRT